MEVKGKILKGVRAHVRSVFDREETSHDFWHIERVRKTALKLARAEKANIFVVELAALLHELDDAKIAKDGHPDKPKRAIALLKRFGADEQAITHVARVIRSVAYRGAGVKTPAVSREARVVQDADRLDALGAVGIARAFAYGGKLRRPLYDPRVVPIRHTTWERYNKREGTTINHFYEKLLLLKERMQTRSGRKMAEERHRYVKDFLSRFLKEWDGRQ